MRVTQLRRDGEFEEASPVIGELHHYLDEASYGELIPEMRAAGYRMFAVRKGDRLVAVAGVQKLTNLYYGRHFYVYDLSVTGDARSRRHVEVAARDEGCGHVALRFYEGRMGYERSGYSMRKALSA
ncbi:MAG TPA: hypothetical protein VKA73_15555 [Rubrobacter sp.]|nr:hypothetical protein [Rubrobacter sp.]